MATSPGWATARTPACARRWLPGSDHHDAGTGDSTGLAGDRVGPAGQHPPGAHEVARVSVRVALEIVLMLRLGLPERPRRRPLRDHSPRPETRRLDVGDRVL